MDNCLIDRFDLIRPGKLHLPSRTGVNGCCYSHDWGEGDSDRNEWDGMESLSGSFKLGMLLDLDEGTLSVYNNGRKLGVMKRGLAGHYCWVVAMTGTQVSIKRGTVPES